jgi:hypothetical protein
MKVSAAGARFLCVERMSQYECPASLAQGFWVADVMPVH